MRHFGLRSVRNGYGTRKATFSHGKSKKRVEPISQDQNPTFLLGQEGKNGVLRGYCGIQIFNMVIVPHVKPDAKEVGAVPRRPYPQTARLGRRAMATSMALHQRRPHYKGRTLERGLAMT